MFSDPSLSSGLSPHTQPSYPAARAQGLRRAASGLWPVVPVATDSGRPERWGRVRRVTSKSPECERKKAWRNTCSNHRTRETLKCSIWASLPADDTLAHTVLFKQCILVLNKTARPSLQTLSSCPHFIILVNSGALIPGRANLVSFSSAPMFPVLKGGSSLESRVGSCAQELSFCFTVTFAHVQQLPAGLSCS